MNLSLVARVRTGGKGILCGYTEDADGLKTKGLFVARGRRRRNCAHLSRDAAKQEAMTQERREKEHNLTA